MFQNQVNLSRYSNYKIGGVAEHFYAADKIEKIIRAVEKARQAKLPIFILGGGTNLLISDKGFAGLVLKPDLKSLKFDGVLMKVGAGVPVSDLLEAAAAKSLAGLEWAGGLPGTLGGAVRGNAGAFGGEMKDCIKEVVSLDISGKTPVIKKRNNKQCRFGYRDSAFKQLNGKEIILEVTLALVKGDKKAINFAIEEKIKYRQERQPLDYPNIGSIFKNVPLTRITTDLNADIAQINKEVIRVIPRGNQRWPAFTAPVKQDPFPVVPVAHLIHQAGLKGVSFGGAMISSKHPNFIVNALSAKATDVKMLIRLIKASVNDKFGVGLEEEIQII
ncbi:MAG: UDP-N-acetylmuramate dehydrogenase [Patescibacteria group bacterium]